TDVVDGSGDGELVMDEPFVLLGRQGDERITPGELARLRGSIPYEVFCAFGARLDRVEVGGERLTRDGHALRR
ncbi:MAG: alanine racemase C-terminal domain-containing protein, partial [Candidatus Limnocylindrales bacterium]